MKKRGRKEINYYCGMVCVCFALAATATEVAADSHGNSSLPWKKAELRAGLFVPIYQSKVRVDSKRFGRGTEIDLEDDLGLDSEIFSYRIDAQWKMFPRHTLYFSYFDLSRNSDRRISRTLQIGDRTFTVGANVSTETDIQIFQATYGFSFILNEKFDVSANIGAYLGNLEFRYSAPLIGSETQSFLAPLPVIGLRASYAITPRFFVTAGANVFFVEYDKYSGSMIDASITFDYDLFEHFGIGIGYNHNRINIERDDDDRNMSLDFGYGAIMLYLRVFL